MQIEKLIELVVGKLWVTS